jgi:hypothetical protein
MQQQAFKKSTLITIGLALVASSALATPIDSLVSTLGGPAIDFEGRVEGEPISSQFAGLVLGQVDGGRPMIDNDPFLFGYTASSGVGVLTGSTEGGALFPTVAALKITLDSLGSAIEFFLSDTAPLSSYTISAFGDGDVLLESFQIPFVDLDTEIGRYVGFTRPGDLRYVTVDSDFVDTSEKGDGFAIDDVRFVTATVPEPTGLVFLGLGLASLAFLRRGRA